MRPGRYPCSDPEPHDGHAHTDGPDNYFYWCTGEGFDPPVPCERHNRYACWSCLKDQPTLGAKS